MSALVDDLEVERAAAASIAEHRRDELVGMLLQHAHHLERLAERIVAGQSKPNPLGEDQGAGARIDVACASYRAALEHLAALDRLVAAQRGDAGRAPLTTDKREDRR